MATSQPALAAGRGLVAVRSTLLGEDGSRDFCGQADTSAYSMCAQSLSATISTEAGETQTLRCGSGESFATFETDDVVTGIDLVLVLAAWDIEFIILNTSATPLIIGGDYSGWSGGQTPGEPVEFHFWEEAYAGGAVSAPPAWHIAFPYVKWTVVPVQAQEGFNTITLNGKVQSNSNLGNGSFLDIPVAAFEESNEFQAVWRDNDTPDPDVSPYSNGLGGGFIATPACAS